MGAKFSSGGGATVFYDKTDTPGEIVTELVNASDGAGLHFEDTGRVSWTNTSATNLGTSDFSVEFVLNQTAENTSDNYIWFTNASGNNRAYLYNDISDNVLRLVFINSSGSASGTNLQLAYDMSADYNTPTHYTVTVDRSGDATLYKNGNSVASVSVSAASAIDLGDGNSNVGQIGSSAAGYSFLGTMYRFRTWNKALSSAEVQTAYERADVPVADQYGSASNEITNGNFETNTSGWTSENTSVFQRNTTSPISGTGDLKWTGDGSGYPAAISNSFSLTAGKKYRIKFTYRVTSGTVYLKFGKTAGAASAAVAGISEVALTASSNTAYEATITPTETTTAYIVFRGNNNTTPTMFVDLVDFVQIGCVSDYQTQWANPTQSLTVQDASGNADGTCSASGVTQVQPVVQGNLTSLAVSSGTARTPNDGDVVAEKLGAGVVPVAALHVKTAATTGSSPLEVARLEVKDEGVNMAVGMGPKLSFYTPHNDASFEGASIAAKKENQSDTNEATSLTFSTCPDGGTNTEHLTIDSTGNVSIGGSGGGEKLFVEYDTDNSSSWWRNQDAGQTIYNTNATSGAGPAIKLQGANARLVYGVNSTNDSLTFSSRNAEGDTAQQIKFAHDGLATFSGGIAVSGGFTNIGSSFTEVTIASGAITVTKSVHFVDTEGDAATDDLDTINGGTTGAILVLRNYDNARDVTVKDATGNIYLAGDFALNNGQRKLTLMKYGGGWYELSRSANA